MEQQLEDEVPAGADAAGARLLRPFVAEALEAPPGPQLLESLTALLRRGDLTARELVEVNVGWKRMISHCTGGQLTAVADLDRAMPSEGARRGTSSVPAGRRAADELAPALSIAPQAASRLVNLARRLDTELPAAADALAEGRMDPTQLRVLTEVTAGQPANVVRRVEDVAVRRAPTHTSAQLREALETEAQQADPDFAARSAAQGRAGRDAYLRPSRRSGCKRLILDLPLLQAIAAWMAVNNAALAAKKRGVRADGTVEDRGMAALRADIAAALLTGVADPDDPSVVPTPEELNTLAKVEVVVPADSLSGDSDLPARVPGFGPLDLAFCRWLATRVPWRRLVADPRTGTLVARGDLLYQPCAEPDLLADPRWRRLRRDPIPYRLLDSGSRAYAPTRHLRDHVRTRDATCIGPACHHSSQDAQLDHTIDYGVTINGVRGRTTEGNLGSVCQRIHNGKTHGGWQLRQPHRGSFIWTSPTGRVYYRRAYPLLPGWHNDVADQDDDGS
jgi:hypothetical protein